MARLHLDFKGTNLELESGSDDDAHNAATMASLKAIAEQVEKHVTAELAAAHEAAQAELAKKQADELAAAGEKFGALTKLAVDEIVLARSQQIKGLNVDEDRAYFEGLTPERLQAEYMQWTRTNVTPATHGNPPPGEKELAVPGAI